ncbi:polysaccharide deacetylase family protein [Clostridium botulinum]|uniref:Xylanase deacetylase n=1 Tax=Clostridium botulinum TaxID=1491 RepID=A0A9Q1UYC4_CLOBO|nr:polysaccharide deacetylase family protein [Clostridium botulinum]AEB76861.1 Predicted xylanase/chitin deacetilase [Clostridium botulinum BKT015925]KEI03033.1 xylanase deacetylase [Clostridium botulinum C/D str. Sp77]KLU77078.1 xylanase deacetylase [Clostridium botulinum V891]KOA74498.1 xylanase deacetylase [Clostridium botulinum]KOA84817.1 xylanase deacetylase [Clostridium botulinum]
MKKNLALISTIIFSLSLAGCTSKQNKVATPSTPNTKVEQKIDENTTGSKPNLNTPKKITNTKDLKHNNEGVPVIMYHSIKYEKNNCVRLPKENFENQMKYLKDNNYTTLTLDELYSFFENNIPIPKKSVVLTFDDGYKDNYETAYPILKKYGFKATVFVITNCIDTGEYLTSEQLKELDKNGFDVQSHTANHETLTQLPYDKQYDTVAKSKGKLEKLLNKEVKFIAYPCGKYNNDTIKAVKNAGYKMAVTTDGRWSDKSDGIFTLDRVFISGFHNINTFKNRISNPNYDFN